MHIIYISDSIKKYFSFDITLFLFIRNTSVRYKESMSSSPHCPAVLLPPSQYNAAYSPNATSKRQPYDSCSYTSTNYPPTSSSNTSPVSEIFLHQQVFPHNNKFPHDLNFSNESIAEGTKANSTLVELEISDLFITSLFSSLIHIYA